MLYFILYRSTTWAGGAWTPASSRGSSSCATPTRAPSAPATGAPSSPCTPTACSSSSSWTRPTGASTSTVLIQFHARDQFLMNTLFSFPQGSLCLRTAAATLPASSSPSSSLTWCSTLSSISWWSWGMLSFLCLCLEEAPSHIFRTCRAIWSIFTGPDRWPHSRKITSYNIK